jgi:ABC-type lipoprotein export system ATPase subunit
MGEPSLLLCDEPTGNLDSKSAANVLDILGDLSSDGLTLVVITHDEHVAGRADRRVRIIDGELGEISPGAGVSPESTAPHAVAGSQ